MKKLYFTLAVLVLLCTSGCVSLDDGVPSYFLEPDGYVIATVDYGERGLFGYSVAYGYISKESYEAYLSGELNGVMTILHPWKEGKSVSISAQSIVLIKTGEYNKEYGSLLREG